MTNQFSTSVTRLFGTRLPIVAGGLQWLADGTYVAAAARSGIIGFMTAASHADVSSLRNVHRLEAEMVETVGRLGRFSDRIPEEACEMVGPS